jgi:8-amino-7-oxononanoate synthase
MPLQAHHDDLRALAERSRLRSLAPIAGIDFASNDYLALAASPRLRDAITQAATRGVPAGSGGSRLLRGNHPEIDALEAEAAAFFRAEAALFFANGYLANLALFATLPQRGDLILHDARVHASAHDGMRLSRAPAQAVPHNDAAGFDAAIRAWRAQGGIGMPWLAVESLYSMDGDRAPLADLLALAERHHAMLLVDEAHATGVFGTRGAGLAEPFEGHPRLVTLHTCGKALGSEGALVAGSATMRDFLVNRARPFIFTTAPSPLIAACVRESLRSLADEPERRARLHALVAHAERMLAPHGVAPTGSQILPLILGEDARAMQVAARLQAAGFDVRGIRPPTVPEGSARLRISLTLNVTPDDVTALCEALAEALR